MNFSALPLTLSYPPLHSLACQAAIAAGVYLVAHLTGHANSNSKAASQAVSASIIGGALLSSFLNFDRVTAALAAVGAVTGYICSTGLSRKDNTWQDSLGFVAVGTVLATIIAVFTRPTSPDFVIEHLPPRHCNHH